MARGNPSGRGGNRGGNRGGRRGRGFFPANGRGRGGGYNPIDDLDFTIYDFDENAPRPNGAGSGFNSPRARGRGSGFSTPRGAFTPSRGGFNTPRGGYNSPRGGYDSPRGRGRGRKPIYKPMEDYDIGIGRGSPSRNTSGSYRGRIGKNWESRMKAGVPLSRLLNEDRPLLRPIVFVRSVYTATLFQQEEEILKPLAEDVANDEKSHVPTADQVTRVFGGEVDGDEVESEAELEEIDFSEVGRIQAEVDAVAAEGVSQANPEEAVVEEKFTGFYVDTTSSKLAPASISTHLEGPVLGEEDEDEEIIVYVAPHPRAGPITPPNEKERVSTPSAVSEIAELPSAVPRAAIASEFHESLEGKETLLSQETRARDHLNKLVDRLFMSAQDEIAVENQEPAGDSAAAEVSYVIPAVEDIQMSEETPAQAIAAPRELQLQLSGTSTMQDTPIADERTVQMTSETAPKEIIPRPSGMSAVQHIQISEETAAQPDSDTTRQQASSEASPAPKVTEDTQMPEEPALRSAADGTTNEAPVFEGVTFSTLKTAVSQRKYVRKVHPARTPRSLIKKSKPRRRALHGFGLYGASLAEAHLQEEDPRKAERRIGDSDLDWGDDSEGGGVDELSAGVGAMDIDSDIDVKAMSSFLNSMSASGSRQVTFDDIADTELMRQEDEDEDENGSEDQDSEGSESDEETGGVQNGGDTDIMKEEEALLVAEAGQVTSSDEEDDSTDNEETPRRGFQKRLQRIRDAKGKQRADVRPESSENDDDDDAFHMMLEKSWADQDEEYIEQIQALVDANVEELSRKDRKQHDRLFRSIQDGDFDHDDYDEFVSRPATRNKDKYKDLPPHLREQWERDREKKAEHKRKRAMDRMLVAADALAIKKGGKKGMKATLAAVRLDPSIEIPNRIVDLVSLEQQIRRFLADLGGKREMVLPPCDKETRKKVHELAEAFSLKSKSKGNGSKRYTTLIKTTKSGVGVNERKVRRIMRSVSGDWAGPGGGKDRKAFSLAKHQEGEEVGKAAPKIGETNIGFRMLAAMGWSEGNSIGLSGGLDAPLTAKMKKTKLGLGATF